LQLKYDDLQQVSSHSIASLESEINNLQSTYVRKQEQMSAELLDKGAQLQNALRDVDKYRGLCDQRETEMAQMRDVIEDLEDKNRKLVDKLNQQILSRVTEYKEKALQALTKNDNNSPGKARRASDARLNQVLMNQDENRPIDFNRSVNTYHQH
jgi:predicted  nucleic acid-binding Zn-ribbon protein